MPEATTRNHALVTFIDLVVRDVKLRIITKDWGLKPRTITRDYDLDQVLRPSNISSDIGQKNVEENFPVM